MTQILITSTVLIVVILLLRLILRKRVSKRLIYATWLLVALRLLIPIQFGQSEYSVVTVTERLTQDSEPVQQVQQSFREPVAGPSREELYQQLMQDYLAQTKEPVTAPQPEASIPTSQPSVSPELHAQIQQEVEQQIAAPTLGQIFNIVWISGMVLMAGWFLITNLLFLRRARKDAIACTDVTAPVRIRISPNVSTPCLEGLFRPVIYLTPLSVEDSQTRNHVLTHELTHLRHLDHIWAWIRCICLCVYWFHPLVWVAAIVSKRDCELACDEAALKKLGDSERIAYRKTLLATVTHSPARVLQTATAMSETKKQLKERVNFIVKKPKNLLIAAVCLILAVTLTAGLVFTGCKSEPEPTTPSTSQDPTTNPDSVESTPDMPTEDDMLELLNQAAQMVENNATVTLDNHWLVKSYLDFNELPSEAVTISDDTITIQTNLIQSEASGTDEMIYATFLALLAKQYPDDFTDIDIHYDASFNRTPFYHAFFYTGWKEAGYDSIKDYYAAVDAGDVEMPQNAFEIGYQYPYINLVSSQNVTDDIYDIFISQRNQAPDTTLSEPTPQPSPDKETLAIAEDCIYRYMWYRAVGTCCDFELVVEDMSQHLAPNQKENYFNQQYRLLCCHTADQVLAHIDRYLAKKLQDNNPADRLFTVGEDVYLIILPTEFTSYGHFVTSTSDEYIKAEAYAYDEDGVTAVVSFHIDSTGTEPQITDVKTSNPPPHNHDYEVTTVAPTCANEGYDLHKCKLCDYFYSNNFVPCLEHNYETTTVEPTCTEEGYTLRQCACGDRRIENAKAAIGHSYRINDDMAMDSPTTIESGYCYKTCQNCGDTYKTILVASESIDSKALIVECEDYARSLGFNVVASSVFDYPNNNCVSDQSVPTLNLCTGISDPKDNLKNIVIQNIDTLYDKAKNSHFDVEKYYLCISIRLRFNASLNNTYHICVEYGLPD